MLEQIGSMLWLILGYCWNGFTWAFHAEERMALQFDVWGLSLLWQIPILSVFNAVLIAVEILIFSGVTKFRKCKEPKIPRFISAISRGKPFGLLELAILAFVPWGQKFGSFIFATQRKHFGLRGYIALCIGGTLRLALMACLPKEILWGLIAGMIVMRFLTWWFTNGRKHS